jgi:membrane fusion protein, multidrug efflux system
VKAGDILYRIDPAPFEVQLAAAEAALAKAHAELWQTGGLAKRLEKLVKGRDVAELQYDNAVAAVRQAQADVGAHQADVAKAKLDLDYTTVRSPISGTIGRALVMEGALVGQGEATHLAMVQQLDPIYADFVQSVSELHQLRRDLENGAARTGRPLIPPRCGSSSTTGPSIPTRASCFSPT